MIGRNGLQVLSSNNLGCPSLHVHNMIEFFLHLAYKATAHEEQLKAKTIQSLISCNHTQDYILVSNWF